MPQRGRRRARLVTTDVGRILAVQALRAFAYGLGSVLIGVALARRGLSGVEAGGVLGALLAGAALASLILARFGDRIGRRRAYGALLVLMGAAGTVFALTGSLPALVLAALTGAVSTDVVESGPFTSLEQAMLPHATDRDPTALFGAYNTIATLAGALGALAAGGPSLLHTGSAHWLLAYPIAAALALPAAAGLSQRVEAGVELETEPRPPLNRSRGIVYRLAALFAVDSLGGGFVVQAFIAYWFSRKFGTSAATLGVVFFAVGILQALSFQAAVRLAERIGLLRTMVFTHLPSNVLLAAVPLAPSQSVAIALLLSRFALSQMDVPARQAYVVGVVDPGRADRRSGNYQHRPVCHAADRAPARRPADPGRARRPVCGRGRDQVRV